ncbi:MAG: hypothetical protein PF638_08315 [Candidatus Delongbacteria bacterium]|nr:hypothetical protein [Candidatus Delongbacteria bacterium]
MQTLSEKLNCEIENINKTLSNLSLTIERKEYTVIELTAMGGFLHNFYNGIENIFKQIIIEKNIPLPTSHTWHKDILDITDTNDILSNELVNDLYEFLGFRHYFVHGYGFTLKEKNILELSNNAFIVWKRMSSELDKYLN